MCFLLVDCFAHCRLTSKQTVLSGLDDSMLAEDQTLNCDPAQSEDESELRPLHCIVAYGLGHFSTCPIACYQFALLLLLVDILKVRDVSLAAFYVILTFVCFLM